MGKFPLASAVAKGHHRQKRQQLAAPRERDRSHSSSSAVEKRSARRLADLWALFSLHSFT